VVKFLGHILTEEGRLPDPKAVEAIVEWKDPTTTKEVRSFLGATLYYREYIYQYSDMAMPLYDLIKKGVVVEKEWDQQKHGAAVQRIKDALTSKPVLMQVDNTKKFRLKVDACRVGRGIGCILEQQNSAGKWQPVSYYSSSLSKEERNYSATELECKALHDCILHYAVYLKYIPHFEVFSDHNALRYMVNSENATTNGRLMRYLLDLQEYNFAIYYRKGTENCDADAVSRLKRTSDQPVYLTEDDLNQENGVITAGMLQRARALDARNQKVEKEARRLLNKLAKTELEEMSILNDHILAEGVENLESESGRTRFFENLKIKGLKCSREKLDETLEEMKAEKGRPDDSEDFDEEDRQLVNLTKIINQTGGVDATTVERTVLNCMLKGEEGEAVPYSVALEKRESSACLEGLLINMVAQVAEDWENKGRTVVPRQDLNAEKLESRRKVIVKRVKNLESLTLQVQDVPKKEYGLRKKRRLDYDEEVKVQPNWKRDTKTSEVNPISHTLHDTRKFGRGRVDVRKSLIPGDTGWGLFAVKKMDQGTEICSYEGVEVSQDTLRLGYGNRDYVAAAVKNHKTKEMIYIDALNEFCCYGRFSQDPIDELLVNAKIMWRNGRLVLIAMVPIEPGDEIYVSYGRDYWMTRLHYLSKEHRQRMEKRCKGLQVEFDGEVTVVDIVEETKRSKGRLEVRKEGVPLQKAAANLQTRIENYEGLDCDEDPQTEEAVLDQKILDELSYENVNQCEELAQEVQFLNGRKFEDEGRLYEIWQVRFDPESEMVIGFRKPLSGRTHKEDGSAFAVYGREGLYELSERYFLSHPEERNDISWPANSAEWAKLQKKDKDLKGPISELKASGGDSMIVGRHKFKLVATEDPKEKLLVRVIVDNRKGLVEQTMVPSVLVKSVLRVHHEGYGHLGANRMLETVRLRYFWSRVDKDILEHTSKCINCKLRKSYQRRPKVPVMKYDDTRRPLDRVHIDLTGPLPVTKAKNKYIMVIKDYLTKYVWLVPLKSKGSVEVAEAFVGEFVCQAGIPGRVVSDKGNEFVNQLLKDVSRILGINRVSTTPYNPRSDGFVENHNKTMKDQLFHFVDTLKQDDWDVFLPTVQLMYNTTVSMATGYTPMLLMTGREGRMPSFNHLAKEEGELQKDVVNNEYVLKLIESMRCYHDFAINQAAKEKESFNVRVKQPLEFVEYAPGDKFLRVRRPISTFKSADDKEKWKISMKLLERFEGPYEVIRKISPVLYDANVEGVETRVHAINMKPF